MIEKSFLLVRTNPSLTGNVKLVISSDYQLYLESFNTNQALSNKKFKHFLIKKEEYWKEVLQNFFADVENDTIFDPRNINDISETYNDYQFQYDDTYFSGADFIEDNSYNESFEYSAPLYMKTDSLPTDFIIFRIDGLGSVTEDSDSNNIRDRIINKLKFVSRFDLTENSDLGFWIKNNFITDTSFPQIPMMINHGDVELSQLSGVDVTNSGWTTKYINLHETQSQNTPIFKSEEYFTNLWKNNNLIYPHILNFKFLFDDTVATPTSLSNYTINRYLGFYIDEKVLEKTVSPFKGFDLNVSPFDDLDNLNYTETSEIPFIENNTFIREIDGRKYSFDPIKNGWEDGNTYWIEYKQQYYKLTKSANTIIDLYNSTQIIGDFLYRIVSPINIERLDSDLIYEGLDITKLSSSDLKIAKRVLINDLGNDYITGTTYKNRINIIDTTTFNTVTGNNIIENSNTNYIIFKRNWTHLTIDGIEKFVFTIRIIDNENFFKIDNFEEADIHLININGDYHVIKQYDTNTPNIGDKYYINSDRAININEFNITSWINNGNISLDPLYYKNQYIQYIDSEGTIPFFNIYRLNITDIKDFDFDRIETDYSRYEYEEKYNIKNNIEPKIYAKSYTQNKLEVFKLNGDVARRIPILDENERAYNLRDQRGELNYATGLPYTPEELYYKELDNTNWQLFNGVLDGTNWNNYDKSNLNLGREYYREENYIWKLDDEDDNILGNINFKTNTDNTQLFETLTWGINNKSEISDKKMSLPSLKSVDPNEQVDTNFVPVSSEYIGSDELWELRNGYLTEIWNKNQSIVKWSALNSRGSHDYEYRLNYSLEIGAYNREPNPSTTRNFVERNQQNLDYFYRFNLLNKEKYQNYSIHLEADYFNIDDYLSKDYDYFETLFNSDQLTSEGLLLTKKYSSFFNKSIYSESETIFKGVKYLISDVKSVIYDSVELEKNGTKIIDDIITTPNTLYNGYRFSIIFGKKLSTFTNDYIKGGGNSNMGIDIYLNDYWKNIVIHLYIDTDETIQLTDNTEFINAETSEIDLWYKDINDTKDVDITNWDNLEFKINNFGINLRPRDFKLMDIINFIKNKNFDNKGTINKNGINFIHTYNKLDSKGNPLTKVMNWKTTDFILDVDIPSEILVKEDRYKTVIVDSSNIPTFDINNSLSNRKITNDNNGNATYTADGLLIDSVNDINCYNDYPIAKNIIDGLDTRNSWELDDNDPSLFRFNSIYTPIFKNIPLFRPLMYKELRDNNTKPKLPKGNWKFYDPKSSTESPNVIGFGNIDELIFSKCNNNSSVLKIKGTNNKEKSVYPMVDEYGYDFDSRYLFASNIEPSFHYISKQINVPTNPKVGLSGYTIHYDGISEYLRIPDQEKFNQETFLLDDANYNNYIKNPTTGERKSYSFPIELKCVKDNIVSSYIKIIKGESYTLDIVPTTTPLPSREIIYRLDVVSNDGLIFSNMYYIKDSEVVSGLKTVIFNYSYNQTQGNKFILEYIRGDNTISETTELILGLDDSKFNNLNLYTINFSVKYVYEIYNPISINLTANLKQTTNLNNSFLDIQTNDYFINNNDQNQLGDLLIGSFIKLDNEPNNIDTYPAFSKISNASTFTQIELDVYDKSTVNSYGEKLWKEFAGLSLNKRPGRIGVPSYNYSKYPIPTNWSGYVYIDILNRLESGSGDILKNDIIVGGNYGYNDYIGSGTSNEKFDRSCLYHFLEYGSQKTSNSASLILNEFYKMTGINNFFTTPRNFNTSFPYNNIDIMRISNTSSFNFEPDRTTHINDGNQVIYSGNKNGNLTSPFIDILWYLNYRDKKLAFNIIPDNGNTIVIDVPLINPITYTNYTITEIITEINTQLINSPYEATNLIGININNTTIKISTPNIGSYYNFNIVLITNNDFAITNISKSEYEKTLSEKLTKTSINTNRRSGRINDTTIEFWIKVDDWSKDFETILYKGADYTGIDIWLDETFNDFTWIIGKNGETNKLAFKTCHEKLVGGYNTHTLISKQEINDGNWHHIACISDLLNRKKQIYIDGILDNEVSDYLPQTIVSNTEKLALFVERRSRFIQGIENPKLGLEQQLANKIRIFIDDKHTIYWSNVILGLEKALYSDLVWQKENWAITLDVAYENYSTNFDSLDYYLRVDADTLSWDILIGTDSAINNSKRNFEGFIDELRIWNYSRTESEINKNYRFILKREAYMNPFKTIIAYFRFDEGQGINKLKDLTDNYLIKSIDRWCSMKAIVINDGKNATITDETSYYHFIQTYYGAENISIDDNVVDWDISGAKIIGISNERSLLQDPSPIFTNNVIEITSPQTPITKNTLLKRRMSRLVLNVKESIFNYTTKRSFEYTFINKWWLFKTIESRTNEQNLSSTVRYRIEREGKNWLTQISNLINKKRSQK